MATVIATRLGDSFKHEEFWTAFIHWLTLHPMFDSEFVKQIVEGHGCFKRPEIGSGTR